MAVAPKPTATLDDLAREPGKAELIGGRIVRLMPTGRRPNRVAGRIFRSLADFAERFTFEVCELLRRPRLDVDHRSLLESACIYQAVRRRTQDSHPAGLGADRDR